MMKNRKSRYIAFYKSGMAPASVWAADGQGAVLEALADYRYAMGAVDFWPAVKVVSSVKPWNEATDAQKKQARVYRTTSEYGVESDLD